MLPLVLGRPEGWPLWTWLCLAASIPAFALFVLAQRRLASRGGAPLVNVHVLAATRAFATVTAAFTAVALVAAFAARRATRPHVTPAAHPCAAQPQSVSAQRR